jgi:hypothetical protein
MFDSATSTLEYRPEFGRRAPATRVWATDNDTRGGRVDAITAELRQRILAAHQPARHPTEPWPAR